MITFILSLSLSARAQTTFEAFYRIDRGREHVGFVVQRLRRDGDRRILTSYLRMRQPDDTQVFESFKSTARADGTPLASEHHGNAAGLPPIFARFAGGRGRVDFGEPNGRRPATVERYDLLGSFLFFIANVPAFRPGDLFRYRAFAEERGSVQTGTLHVAGVEDVGGVTVYRVLDDFLGEPVENFIAANGQPLGSRALGGDLSVYWVASRDDAIGMFTYPNRDVITLFGDLPAGRANVWSALRDFRADRVVAAAPKWLGRRVLTLSALEKVAALPRRAL